MDFLYLIGIPGAGKSTLIEELTAGHDWWTSKTPMPHIVYDTLPAVGELGARREFFRGTDATSMSIQPTAIEFVRTRPFDLMLAEGDRLATSGFLSAVEGAGYNLTVVRLDTPESLAGQRRAARFQALRVDPQDPTWVKGRVTKVERLAEEWDAIDIESIDELRELSNPVVNAFALSERTAVA